MCRRGLILPLLLRFPLGKDIIRLPIFVPWDPAESDAELLSSSLEKFKILKGIFKVANGKEVYDLYKNSEYMAKLYFEKRKQFMILFHHYVINVPAKKALEIAGRDDYLQNRIPCIDSDLYDSKIGLKTPFNEFDNII